jgi:hypothetical protein
VIKAVAGAERPIQVCAAGGPQRQRELRFDGRPSNRIIDPHSPKDEASGIGRNVRGMVLEIDAGGESR